ncbi:tetratricopeptide repeat protein [Phycisphaera mikurensis]|uniref:Tetratricopeptide repeat protein n=1 Tax=Phycisphaera mikurensis (strain NBRC 102666 / KCTC 22515 / FYK2301M01) TaxID=1142394 RepID=I0IE22_PHYMF|nr:tetratricopeptide repeat protein [Phycisphaera mikurensis]MBB6441317.1 tetratricopeptide (TPR) repeat protein [Phycisphaera mikurensis]BAM03510.1 hypothetical protein PSMK_13510 [Phycisphaera mikurensis NBRC 102666]
MQLRPAPSFLFVAALVLTGCAASPSDGGASASGGSGERALPPTATPPARGEAGGVGAAGAAAEAEPDGRPRPGLEPPPGLDAAALAPLEGEALAAAQLPLAEIRAGLPEPVAGDAAAASSGEPPLQAQRLFGRAQQALLENDHAEAVQMLEAAARLAPGQPRILRELARGWLALGNRPRAVQHLREAVRRRPDDHASRLLLGQLLVDAGEPQAGLAELLLVADAADAADPALRPLAAFQAGRTLVTMDRLAAAVGLFGVYRDASREGMRASRTGAALLDVDRVAAGHLAREGDLRARLGDPRGAADAYDAAVAALPAREDGSAGVPLDPQLVGRLVWADLRLGRDASARERLVGYTERTGAAPAALALVAWAVEAGLPGGPMVAELRRLEESGAAMADPAAVALALAVSLPREEAVALLRERQQAAGFEPRVYDALLGLLLEEEAGAAGRSAAVELVMETLRSTPRRGYLAVASWFRRAGGPAAAAAAVAATPAAAAEDDAAALTLRAVVERQLAGDGLGEAPAAAGEAGGAGEEASAPAGPEPAVEAPLAQLARAVELQPDLALARVERARLLGVAGRHAEALAELDAVAEGVEDPRIPRLRVGLLLADGRRDEAAAALDRLVVENPRDLTLVLQRAQLLAASGDAAGAERALLDALAANPRAEPLYAALLRLYDDARLGPTLPDYPQNYERLRRRIFQEIPETRVARLTAAAYLEASGDNDQARRVLTELLEANPNDREAQFLLLDVLRDLGDAAAADALVEDLLAAGRDAPALVAARDHYARTGNRPKLLDALRGLRDLQPEGFARDFATARIQLLDEDFAGAAETAAGVLPGPTDAESLAATEVLVAAASELPAAEAVPLLVAARDASPVVAAVVAYALADAYDRDGRPEEAEATLLEALEASPNDAQLNNAIGYRWAYRGVRLEEAERLIGRAVAAESDNPAYLDSLGWVLYQQGRFEEAMHWLDESREKPGGQNPVILLHAGDTLHRLGRTDEAVDAWSEALANAAGLDERLDPELVGIGDRLQARIDAADGAEPGVAVPVARTGAEPGEAGSDVPVPVAPPAEPEAPASQEEPAQAVEAGDAEPEAATPQEGVEPTSERVAPLPPAPPAPPASD